MSAKQLADFDFETGEVLLLDKPLTWTSFDVVRKVKNALRIKKIGHAGTLDPLATGLLILCTGKKTKEIDLIQAQEKEYAGTFRLGETTPSFDLETAVDMARPYAHLTPEEITSATLPFVGTIQQTPPLFSAVKIDGKRAYEIARNGQEAEIKSKTVEIKTFELTRIALPEVDFRVVCSKGTYIRSLARDLGVALGCGAHLTRLVRTRIGEFRVEDAFSLEAIQALRPARPEGEGRPRIERPRIAPNRVGLQYYAALQADALAAKEHEAHDAAAPAPDTAPE
ncbi:tRNA pseudouridine(55) synthase TruB [Hymenobacter sp. BT770]|uniref:tRNA pseudouridine(55) synthase TruB n=1 Tax=Hymenobacter sp. BT770 TaxID=2886942 RepID=UPI001D0FF70B|nr:tRNA pseudouridine(55) synthase TruB [Hymenobacter sp. BT770]MCC3152705.1 tRNA pseudouridine(55) synthase TruB [Hymenobacter sp. BT770]MDO3414778.1 tRNA pseudouridine(55) synthase TruB [Hymenobacter sp. BT770]